MAAYRIAVETGDARLREHAVQQFFQLLRTGAEEIHVFASTVHALLRHARRVAAVVTDHLVLAFMMRESDGTVRAFQFLAAGPAKHHG